MNRQEDEENVKGVATIPFWGSVTNCIAHISWKVKTLTKPHQKIRDLMGSVKDPLGLQVPGVYQIPWSCGKVYVGQTGRTVTIREQEYKYHLRTGNTDKSAVAQHGWDTGHEIWFGKTVLLHRSSRAWQNHQRICGAIPEERANTESRRRGIFKHRLITSYFLVQKVDSAV